MYFLLVLGNRGRVMRGTQLGRRCSAWDQPPIATISFSMENWTDPYCRCRSEAEPWFFSLRKFIGRRKHYTWENESTAAWAYRAVTIFQRPPLTSAQLQVNLEPQGVCMAVCRSIPLVHKACQLTRAELCLQELVGDWARVLALWSSFSLHALLRVYYFLSSNCRFQVIISLWRENNIGSYVISTSMNLEVIMEWVAFFPP